uniref:Uncharacterized protein n=1 Tax=Mucochytrium quahogii TaxID=96639 RepID=A0A7S2RH42_9STRA|mmetsp:Transcript_988/g.1579  ORF Transcript_988/g.1579 Transcript_988/m.1579 type:complete len:385 (-) Transcript_988:103-1257(-)|eukprot:CAMPEP_0203763590 /NCGR_PEP_ID=MMETSP0098-20131031/16477_1 /ASSEMBLY_ACC=CAM_ASM_000208 /TAXON_ID=96639 /ORGANISM=" , Strain NY0313808BC1" /LENGTH=384 /DNA_ID=CAMNT_0050658585 /DNA_START=308 /DNA_END=1462 /DNA_ORIENTATION=-
MGCCTYCVLVVAVLFGVIYSGLLTQYGVFYHAGKYALEVTGMPFGVGFGTLTLPPGGFKSVFDYSDVKPHALDGKVALVTGGNAGLGYYTALHLAEKGARTVIACRNKDKGNKAVADIKAAIGSDTKGTIEMMILDTSSMESVSKFTKEFKSKFKQLDIFVQNAGIANIPIDSDSINKDGIETIFATNHLGHFKITLDLLDLIDKAADINKDARVVFVAAPFVFEQDKVYTDLKSLNAAAKGANLQALNPMYGHSKVCNVLFCTELARRLRSKRIYINSLHPGGVISNIWGPIVASWKKALPGPLKAWPQRMLDYVMNNMFFTSEQGALTQFYLAASPDVATKGTTGKYFHQVAFEVPLPAWVTAEKGKKLATDLWKFSLDLLN